MSVLLWDLSAMRVLNSHEVHFIELDQRHLTLRVKGCFLFFLLQSSMSHIAFSLFNQLNFRFRL